MESHLAKTYTLIHAFLRQHSHYQLARALKKAAKDVVALKDDVNLEGPFLDVIIKEWQEGRVKHVSESESSSSESKKSTSNDSDSSSSSSSNTQPNAPYKNGSITESNSESTSSISEPNSDIETASRSRMEKNLVSKPRGEDGCQSSATLTSGSSNSCSSSSKMVSRSEKVPKVASDNNKYNRQRPISSSGSTPNDGSSDCTSSDEVMKTLPTRKFAQGSSSSSTSSDTSSGSSEVETTRPVKTGLPRQMHLCSTSHSVSAISHSKYSPASSVPCRPNQVKQSGKFDTSLNADEKPCQYSKKQTRDTNDVRPLKKQRTTKAGASVPTATTKTTETTPETKTIVAEGKGRRNANAPFQRINPDKVSHHLVQDNGYTAKAGPSNDYGQRAHKDLISTRGAGFRKEKNKKKRGSYKGGEITLESHSFKFETD